MKSLVIGLVLPTVALIGAGVASAAPSPGDDATKQICVVVWNDPNATGRDGLCLVFPSDER